MTWLGDQHFETLYSGRAFPGLDRALESYAAQKYQGPVQIIIGVQEAADPAVAIARRFEQDHPDLDVQIVVDATMHGVNGKISNLMNMMPRASGEILVMSDADVEASADYLSVLARELAAPNVGAATCLYRGRGAAGVCSVLSAMGVDYHFAPSAALGAGLGLAAPCLGPTIAVRSEVMRQIGGLAPFANLLAEDYAIGAAVRAQGLKLTIPPMVIIHLCDEASLGELIAHELRWARTIRRIAPAGHFGSVVTHPFAWALAAAALGGAAPWSLALVAATLVVRGLSKSRIDAAFGEPSGPLWLLPARDVLSFAVFLASLVGNDVVWRGRHYRVDDAGRLSAAPLRMQGKDPI